jgi:azurin
MAFARWLHGSAAAASVREQPGLRICLCVALWALPAGLGVLAAQAPSTPKILLDVSPRAIEYQLGRLSNDELVRVERHETDARYRPVYYALLTRKGIGREYFDEALGALTKMDKAGQTRVLLEALPKIPADDVETGGKLLRVLFGQPAEALRKEAETFTKAADATSGFALQGAYGGMMLADGSPQRAWERASKHEGHPTELLRSVPNLPAGELRAGLFDPVAKLAVEAQDAATKVAALSALGWTRQDAAAFRLLAKEFLAATDPEVRSAAVRSLQRIPKAAWPAGEVEPLARAIVAMVGKTPANLRTDPSTIEAIHLGEALADGLGDEPRRAVRRDLRDLGVQVVRIETIPEQMAFDRKWFAVEAGKPVQIVLVNPDAMAHNLLIGRPGSLKEIGTAASTMTLPSDPKVKPYVPDTPLVLQATRLLNWGETERLGFKAPAEPGEYPFVCTFPGHWVRMYGIMLVVSSLEKWEAAPTVPTDPMTGQAFPAQRN